MSSRENIPVWCHNCSGNRFATLNDVTQEYNCDECSSECVEEACQGIEEFNTTQSTRMSENSVGISESNSDEVDSSEVVDELMSRLMGGDGRQSSAISSRNSAVGNTQFSTVVSDPITGRRIGMIIHPTVAPEELSALLSGANSSNTRIIPLSGGGIQGLMTTQILNGLPSTSSGGSGFLGSAAENNSLAQIMHHILMNENSHAGAPPANEEVLSSLPKEIVSTEELATKLGECNISQEPFEVGDSVVTLPCEHRYKEENIMHWLKMHNTCPVCRIEVK